MDNRDASNLSTLTADIVSAYVSRSSVGKEELGALICGVHAALKQASIGKVGGTARATDASRSD